ncbi:hypothetical protein OOU_Y34scaffold00692g24 [Pyricularia oryzae Y34]|uniref:Uncharacterized protein n=2 Tax=Pyricularia oryzae TaxID=318829 RepID=A0AA97NSU0_PYRO3|nr:hypothetical protein OOU_Y34scaffold00692g24 [Pyricularia oryzae Y34]
MKFSSLYMGLLVALAVEAAPANLQTRETKPAPIKCANGRGTCQKGGACVVINGGTFTGADDPVCPNLYHSPPFATNRRRELISVGTAGF